MKIAEELEKSNDKSVQANVDAAVRSVVASIPTLKEERIRQLSVEQLGMLLQFVRGDFENLANKVAADGEGGAAADSKS